ncbi:hypothetical protein OROHE_004713 [Orobanche hederae]
MPVRNEVSWNTMISAHAFHGRAEDALALFQRMLEVKSLHPDDITFIGMLSACVHAGLVDEGHWLFDLMSSLQLTPKVEHYSCMVDLLSRAGRVYEAWDFIQKMPQKPDEILLGALLVACQKLKNVDIGERVSRLLLEMEPSNSGNYIISSKIFADMRRWEDCARMRTLMKQNGVTKTPGCSWVGTDGQLREFHAGDFLMEDAEKIHRVLDMLYYDMAVDHNTDIDLSRVGWTILFASCRKHPTSRARLEHMENPLINHSSSTIREGGEISNAWRLSLLSFRLRMINPEVGEPFIMSR